MDKYDHKTHPILSKMQVLERSDVLKVLNGTYIARRFFGKSCSWFSQRINENLVNGAPARFTPKEIETLSNALYTIAFELEELADELK